MIGAPDDFGFLSPFPEEGPFAFWLPESSETREGDDGKKQLKIAEKKAIVNFVSTVLITSFSVVLSNKLGNVSWYE